MQMGQRKRTVRLLSLASNQLLVQRFGTAQFVNCFLHGYGRYVCREAQVTLDEFEKKAEKIRARTKETPPPNNQNTKPNNQAQNPQQAKPEPKLAHICSGCEKRSEDPKI